MYPYKKTYIAFLLIFLISACAPSSASESEPTIHKITVPTYITNTAVMDEVESDAKISGATRYNVVKDEDLDDTAINGFIGIFVPTKHLNFDSYNYGDSGQACQFNKTTTYRLKEGHLVVKFFPTTDDKNFIKFCQDQIPKSIEATFVYLDPYENNKIIKYFNSPVEVLVKVDE